MYYISIYIYIEREREPICLAGLAGNLADLVGMAPRCKSNNSKNNNNNSHK